MQVWGRNRAASVSQYQMLQCHSIQVLQCHSIQVLQCHSRLPECRITMASLHTALVLEMLKMVSVSQ